MIVIIITIFRLNIKSTYSNPYTGVVTKVVKISDKTTIYLDNKVIGNVYKKIDVTLGDKVKVYGEFNNRYIAINKYKILSKNKNIYYFIKSIITKSFNNNPYLYTFILGDKSYVSKKVVRSYQENGISHLFAISGMHISLLVLIINKLLKKN